MPVAILEVSGIVRIIAKAGNASSKVFQSMRANPSIIKQPTIINTGAVIAGTSEITLIIGEKKIESANIPATTIEVRPVLSPTVTTNVECVYDITELEQTIYICVIAVVTSNH